MAEQRSTTGRRLPPLSPKSVTSDNDNVIEDTPRKRKKKKQTDEREGVGSNSKTPSRKMRETSVINEEGGVAGTPTKPKKKKKPVGSSREALMGASEGEVLSDRTEPTKKKKRKKKIEQRGPADGEERVDEVGLAAELGDLHDDIVVADDGEQKVTQPVWNAAPTMRSEPAGKVYIEKQSGFKTQDRSKLARKRAEQQKRIETQPPPPPDYNTMQVALGSHKVFKTIILFLQGLFAGIALWHIVAVWTLCNVGFDEFIAYYYKLALPVSCMYYFLFALSTVAVLDRYDVGRPTKRMFVRCCTMQSGMIACLLYLIGLIFSVSITNIDDRIGMKYDGISESVRDSELNKWLILNLMRGLMAIFGWFVISLRPNTDRLSKNLGTDDELFFEQIGDTIMGSMENVRANATEA